VRHSPVRRDLPSGIVTFLFTDVEGSTRLLHELGAEAYAAALLEHRLILRETFARYGGTEVDTQGDAFFVAFPTGSGALDAARQAQEALRSGPIHVRMGIHTGIPHLTEEGYVGQDVHKGARIAAVGHGGQVLLSKEARDAADVEATDLGEHRLKDFDEAVSIFQFGSRRFPPLKTISNTNLPRPASSFVGRDREVEEVISLLQDGARLLSLTGPGGSGKTRLAIEAAAAVVPEFKAGVFWVGLAPLRDPALVTGTIAQTLGAKDGLAEHIAQRELLLLIDNLEQVVESAPELAALVETCPNLKLLVTSRELLRVRGEVEYPVLPLADLDAVGLFCARARTETDETVHELCRALDNLPLALELAAARSSVLSPKQILDRLSKRLDLLKGGRDADPRQQTLRATIGWSHELLNAHEQELFAGLAVFAGGCTLEAAEEVLDAQLDTLQSLVDKSLVRHTAERFWMLETIREYGAERLRDSGKAEEIQRRHTKYFLSLAEQAEPHLPAYRREWLERLEVEHDNLRAALDRLEASGETQFALRLAGALSRFWFMRGYIAEGRRRLESLLRLDESPTAARGKALNGAALVAVDYATSKARAEEALSLHLQLGNNWGAAHSRFLLAGSISSEDMLKARELWEESARSFRELGDDHYLMIVTRSLAWTYDDLDDNERARSLHEENLARARALGNQRIEAVTLGALSMIAAEDGRMDDVLPALSEAARLHRELGDPLESAFDLARFAIVLRIEGAAEAAIQLIACYEAVCEEIGVHVPWATEMNEETVALLRPQLDATAFAAAWEQGSSLTLDEGVALALEALVS
jgi:predicted ATPase/class 3 adenylate cyclase